MRNRRRPLKQGERALGPRRYRATRGVERVDDNWVRKHVDGEVDAEVAKAVAMRSVLAGGPTEAPFARPGNSPQTMMLEDLGNLVSLTEVLEQAQSVVDIRQDIEAAGAALASLHLGLHDKIGDLALRRWGSRAAWPLSGGLVLHGDFTPQNTFRRPGGGYVTLDGSANEFTSFGPMNVGRAEADLATFTMTLCWPLRPLHWRPSQLKMRLAARRLFVQSYEIAASRKICILFPYEMIVAARYLWFCKILRMR